MNWEQAGKYCLQSDFGYTVAKIITGGQATYEAWHGKNYISAHKTADEAKGACEWHQQRAKG